MYSRRSTNRHQREVDFDGDPFAALFGGSSLFSNPRTSFSRAASGGNDGGGGGSGAAAPVAITSEAEFQALLRSPRGHRATVVDVTADWCKF